MPQQQLPEAVGKCRRCTAADRSDIKHVSVQTPCSEKVQTYRRGKCSHTGGNTVSLYTRSPHKFCIYKISLAVALYDIHIYILYVYVCACMYVRDCAGKSKTTCHIHLYLCSD